jgi:hypothetical protein
MAAQHATDLRRLLAEVEENEASLRQRQEDLEDHATHLLRTGPQAKCDRLVEIFRVRSKKGSRRFFSISATGTSTAT